MSKNEPINSVSSKYILKKIFSLLPRLKMLKLIRYNKNLQKIIDINFENEIINYKYIIKSKEEIEKEIGQKIKEEEEFDYLTNFCKKYSYFFEENIDDDYENVMLLTQFKGFKINDYPLPSFFHLLNAKEKIDTLEKNEYFLKYTLNDKNIELINLINKLRIENNIKKLIHTNEQNLNDYFKVEKSENLFF